MSDRGDPREEALLSRVRHGDGGQARRVLAQRLVAHFEQHGEYISAAELEDET